MKANDKQKAICDLIISQANFWKSTNDITSPTHYCDIEESINILILDEIIDEREVSLLTEQLITLLSIIKRTI
jgi:hypothetical protein